MKIGTSGMIILSLGFLASGAAAAGDRCDVAKSEWQPEDALQQQLEAKGWKLKDIRTEDGCYEAYAIDRQGRRVEAYFDPKTLEAVKTKVGD